MRAQPNQTVRPAKVAMKWLTFLLSLILIGCAKEPTTNWSEIEAGFQSPPNSAKPRVWWHWMNGNISKEGIKKDLLWMNDVGIGGFQNFDAGLSSPKVVEQRLVYMTPEWKEAYKYMVDLADSLGMEIGIAGSPGWSESGGPWVEPYQAMKKYVWSETVVEGGQTFSGTLPNPPTATCSFQNATGSSRGLADMGGSEADYGEFYADAAVVAFKVPESEMSLAEIQPKVTSSGGNFTLPLLTDGDLGNTQLLPSASVGQKSWIQFEFDQPQTIQALSIVSSGGGGGGFFGSAGPSNQTLEISNDGTQYTVALEIPSGSSSQNTFSFKPIEAKFFRFCILNNPRTGRMRMPFGPSMAGPSGTQIAELVLHPGARVDRFEDKAGFSATIGLNALKTPLVKESDVVNKDQVIDLTSEMAADGTLNWEVPEGKWIILRLGYSLIGTTNHPASPEATGLEVDKLNASYVRAYLENYLSQYEDATGGLMGDEGLKYIITDSWEAGSANWTDDMITEFNNRNGYDIISWLPVLSGHIVESAEASDKFLWDFRQTLEALVAEYHYDEISNVLKEYNMGRYSESHEQRRALIADGMEVKRNADIPMSAMWVPGGIFGGGSSNEVNTAYKADMRESASVAHIYGQNLVGAESLTAGSEPWGWHPSKLKPTADMEMANGLNRFVIHEVAHQPVDDKIPGLSLGQFGQWFGRHETWAQMAKPWITYLGRSSFLLQQGEYVADVVYLYGEGENITGLFSNELPSVPRGYEYDFVNSDALINVLSVKNGKLVTTAGMEYNVLALDQSTQYMSLPVLKRIRELVNAGAQVVGPKPIESLSLNDDENEYQSIVDELWGEGTGTVEVGKGKLYAGQTIGDVLKILEIEPDFQYSKSDEDAELLYVHRTLEDGEIYWVNSRSDQYETLEATFRVDGKAAEIWNPETGEITKASYAVTDGKTTVPLTLKPHDAVFIVFRNEAESDVYTIPQKTETEMASLDGSWELAFQKGRGAPDWVTLETLSPWNENQDEGIKYFSGIGTYTKKFQVPAEWLETDKQVFIDLGDVDNLAEVILNGQSLGTVWKEPYRTDATNVLTEGENVLEIKVANLWVNRIIGDLQPGMTPVTFTAQHTYRMDSPLLPSGLIGPVKVISLTSEE